MNLKNINKLASLCAVGGVFLLIAPIAEAKIYKCVNIDNKVFYNDKPCPVLDKETEINAVKDPLGGYIPPAFSLDEKQKKSNLVVKTKVTGTFQDDEKKPDSELIHSNNDGSISNEGGSAGNTPVIASSSGRVPVSSSQSASSSKSASEDISSKSAKKYIMKVEESTREPR